MSRAFRPLIAALVAFAATALGARPRASADAGDDAAFRERCATRLSITLLGASPSPELLASTDPRASVGALLETDAFRERVARFVNGAMMNGPGAKPSEDAPYYLMKHLLAKGAPFRDLFVGAYTVKADAKAGAVVEDDPQGLGIFRSPDWLVRYAGNEVSGLKIATAYRILNNVTGVEITAVTTPPGADVTATGRKAPACASCHYENWYALDRIANVLTRKKVDGDAVTFEPSPSGPETLFGGVTVKDDKDLVTALVASKDFSYRACRLSFEFLYGRAENACEADVFDACMAAFAKDGTLPSAVGAIARHPSFCE